MSDIIEMLETLGSNAELRHAKAAVLYPALDELGATPQAQWAALRGDCAGLRSLVGAQTSMACLMMAPEAHLEMAAPLRRMRVA